MRSRTNAYSLYELIITLAIASTILALGVPSFGAVMARQTQRVELNALFHAIHEARKESIALRRVVSLCPSLSGTACDGDWSDGWLMFVNLDRDLPANVDQGEPVIRWHRVSAKLKITANRRSFSLRSTHLRATNGTFVVCDRATRTAPKALVVSYTGRPRVTGFKTNGQAYQCAH